MHLCLLYQILYLKKILNNWVLAIRNNLHEIIVKTSRFKLFGFTHFLRDSTIAQAKQLIDLVVYDKPGLFRFTVFYTFLSTSLNYRISLSLNSNALVPLISISYLFSSISWFEREVFDMYGIIFLGNADMRRILTDYGFKGYPLRKDFPLTGFIELFYSDLRNHIVYKKVAFSQLYRNYFIQSPWLQLN
jgi:NADH-quinone oxidoreductase subunit C